MPTSPAIPIVPGVLCWIRAHAQNPNNGTVVEVTRPCDLFAHLGKFWFAKAKTPINVLFVPTEGPAEPSGTGTWPAGVEFVAKESWLVPIAGPGLVDEVENFDANSQPETIGQLLRDAGLATKPVSTRSTPNVRR